ncbi:hypothetical protein VMCG_04192 [Cytospora schulzeri]|uniref:Uncharacterized protein n=1 Tax=Cytospora schulzeri TaxID=448051 RepID=A0A423WTM2_9PEZI|nr:hypothetical protein VMCG_04192 [Valsa malicola]
MAFQKGANIATVTFNPESGGTGKKMQAARHFPKFLNLPPEIQLQIWESTVATLPSMHIFDMCVPSSPAAACQNAAPNTHLDHHMQPSKRDALCLEESDDTLYLGTLDTKLKTSEHPNTITTQGARFRTNPSMYKFQDSLRLTCIDSANTLQRMMRSRGGDKDLNTIYLPTGRRALTYNNTQDVLHLRFIPPAFRLPVVDDDDNNNNSGGRHTSPISAMFESLWSEGLASALHHARRVAIDVSQLWPGLAEGHSELMQDVAYLACVLQNDLEVLYLVDYCAGRCNNNHDNTNAGAKVGGLMKRDGGLYRKMYGFGDCGDDSGVKEEVWNRERRRTADVFHGVGKTWREVFELERLGWSERHPGFVFAEAFSEVVRMQQGNYMGGGAEGTVKKAVRFKGVRVLIAEDEETDGVDNSMIATSRTWVTLIVVAKLPDYNMPYFEPF